MPRRRLRRVRSLSGSRRLVHQEVAEPGRKQCGWRSRYFDKSGPELARVDDDTYSIWNNKFLVWLNEFSMTPTQ